MARHSTNDQVADLLTRYGQLQELAGESGFRVRAYQRAADALRHHSEPVETLVRENRLTDLAGIGPAIAAVIVEIVTTGRLAALVALEEQVPPTLLDLLNIPGVGVKTVSRLYIEHQIIDLPGLEAAIVAGRLRGLPGLGEKTEAKILTGIESLKRRTGRMRLGTALPIARRLVEALKKELPGQHVSFAGSIRRMEETVADIDIVVASEDFDPATEALSALPEVDATLERTESWRRVRLISGIEVDVYFTDARALGSVTIRATGNAAHLESLGRLPDAPTEELVYERLGFPWIPPELRQGIDELEQARGGQLESIIKIGDIRGEFHSHTTWSDGATSVEEMARAAQSSGYQFLGISDHTRSLGVANGLDAIRIEEQRHDIDLANRRAGIRVFAGAEVEVDRNGALDFGDEILERLDVVIASLHSGLRQPRDTLTDRLLQVLRNRHVDILAHPSGRLLERRDPGDFDWDRVFPVASETGTALEINADPARLDLSAALARRALAAGCLLTINCDAHHPEGFTNLEYGIANARKAGATSDQVLNCWSVDRIEEWLHNR